VQSDFKQYTHEFVFMMVSYGLNFFFYGNNIFKKMHFKNDILF